jgi:hypothetical protein
VTGPAALARLALIIFTVTGVAWMHTFGHSPGHSAADTHQQSHAQALGLNDDGEAATAARLAPVEAPAQAIATACHDTCPDETGMSTFSVCLAIVSSFALLYALAAGWVTRARTALTSWLTAVAWQPTGRSPPNPYLGLRLTRLSVSRT